jgi:hypothetical protein
MKFKFKKELDYVVGHLRYGRIDYSYFQAIIKHIELSKQNC